MHVTSDFFPDNSH